eukprot:evm.model.scf_326.3 EVM.evm.TU.scf_326.3   scf_326:21689-25120(-)
MGKTPKPCNAVLFQHQGLVDGDSRSMSNSTLKQACGECEVLRAQVQEQNRYMARAAEEQSRLRCALLDAETDLQRSVVAEEALTKRIKALAAVEEEKMKNANADMLSDLQKSEVQRLQIEVQETKQLLKDKTEQFLESDSHQNELQKQVADKTKQLEDLQAQLNTLLERLGQLEGLLNSKGGPLESSACPSVDASHAAPERIEAIHTELAALKTELAQCRSASASDAQKIWQKGNQIQRLQEENNGLKAEISRLKGHIAAARKESSLVEEEVSAKLQQDIVEKDKAARELEQMLSEANVEGHKHQTAAKRLENQVQHLKASLDEANL